MENARNKEPIGSSSNFYYSVVLQWLSFIISHHQSLSIFDLSMKLNFIMVGLARWLQAEVFAMCANLVT